MPLTFTITHTRPSVETEWEPMSDRFQERIEHFKSTGHLTSFQVVDVDDLNSTTTIVFPDEESKTVCINDSDWKSFADEISASYTSKSIIVREERTITS
tara:strand:+ start:777 stop:1073 length:297 start_codon:yes stop_codon:yes gene_type:complete